MRFKFVLTLRPALHGNVIPISYQYELSACVNHLLTSDSEAFAAWLGANGLTPQDNLQRRVYAVSNLYVPRICVNGDRLQINVPRVQFWMSFMPTVDTEQYVRRCFADRQVVLGDRVSRVAFDVTDISVVSSVDYSEVMEYTTMSPIVVVGMRPNHRLEYLKPDNPVFAQFMYDELVERYEILHKRPYTGSTDFKMELLAPPKRKSVSIRRFTPQELSVVGYMMRLRLTMSPELQQLAYETGLGDKTNIGFGYIELLNKQA